MKYIDFYGHKLSKLIVGDNPFNGHSYIWFKIPGTEMSDYHTEDVVLECIHRMEELGINTMLPLADPFMMRVLRHYRNNGGKMNFIIQHYAPMNLEASIRQMESIEPIGAYISGSFIDCSFENGDINAIHEKIKTLRTLGVKTGFGTHHPEVIQKSEAEGWDADFYMACMYDLRRGRRGEASGFLTGKSKADIVVVPEDRPVMLETLKSVQRPVIAFKIFGGGQMLVDKTKEERAELITDAYDTIFSTLKPNDFAVMGIFQKYHDQLTENVELFNKWAEKKGI